MEMSNVISGIKFVASTLGSIGASVIVKQGCDIVISTMEDASTFKKVAVEVGKAAIAGVVAAEAGAHIYKTIDDVQDAITAIKEAFSKEENVLEEVEEID